MNGRADNLEPERCCHGGGIRWGAEVDDGGSLGIGWKRNVGNIFEPNRLYPLFSFSNFQIFYFYTEKRSFRQKKTSLCRQLDIETCFEFPLDLVCVPFVAKGTIDDPLNDSAYWREQHRHEKCIFLIGGFSLNKWVLHKHSDLPSSLKLDTYRVSKCNVGNLIVIKFRNIYRIKQ